MKRKRNENFEEIRKKGWVNEAKMVFVLLLMRKSG